MVADIDFRSPSPFSRLLGRLRVYGRKFYRLDWLAMFALARFEIVQNLAGRERRRGSASPRAGAGTGVLRTEFPVAEIIRRVREEGIASGLRLPEAAVADVIAFAGRARCYANGERQRPLDCLAPGSLVPGDAVVGDYLDEIAGCETIARLWRDPEILAVAGGALGTRPRPVRSRLWWSFRADRATDVVRAVHAQDCFHFDLDNWRAVKFFFYLTEVGRDNGPHIYVRNSHRNRPLSDQFSPFKSRSHQHIVARYGRDSLMIMEGSAGTGFVEDPYGFHTGTAVTGAARLILELEYGVARTRPADGPFYAPAIE